jgi:hypothetical protein
MTAANKQIIKKWGKEKGKGPATCQWTSEKKKHGRRNRTLSNHDTWSTGYSKPHSSWLKYTQGNKIWIVFGFILIDKCGPNVLNHSFGFIPILSCCIAIMDSTKFANSTLSFY